MKTITKYICTLAIALAVALNASALEPMAHKMIAQLAENHLTDKARTEVQRLLGGQMADSATWYDESLKKDEYKFMSGWQYVALDEKNLSTTKNENDAVVQIERLTKVLNNRANESDSTVVCSLRALISLVGDMHCISHIRMKTIPLSMRNFRFTTSNGQVGKKEIITKRHWKTYWEKKATQHQGFSVAMYAEDMDVCYGHLATEYSKGTPRDWAAAMGKECKELFKWAEEDYVMGVEQNNRLEPIAYKCAAKAGYRLATILNAVFE